MVENDDLPRESGQPDDHPMSGLLNDENTPNITILGFSKPMTFGWFFSVLGAEYCHTYFWIAKDLSWMQSWRQFSLSSGVLALAWSLLIMFHAIRTYNWHELWNFVTLFLWLFANFWWMIGEAHDHDFPDEPPISLQNTNDCGRMLEAALIWSLAYYFIILPCELIPCNKASLVEYDDGRLKPPICLSSFFKTFRRYENVHMLFWIAKDLAWNRESLVIWLLCLVPTLAIAVNFLWIAATTPSDYYSLDCVHFGVTLIWVIGNSVWAFGDFFLDDEYDEPIRMWIRSEISWKTARWHSSWILITAAIPVVVMYTIWGVLTITGRLQGSTSSSARGGPRVLGLYRSIPTWVEMTEMEGGSRKNGRILDIDKPSITSLRIDTPPITPPTSHDTAVGDDGGVSLLTYSPLVAPTGNIMDKRDECEVIPLEIDPLIPRDSVTDEVNDCDADCCDRTNDVGGTTGGSVFKEDDDDRDLSDAENGMSVTS